MSTPEAAWQDYTSTLPSFDQFEAEYQRYVKDELLHDSYKPAISVADLFKRPQLPITSYVPGFVYAGSLNLIAGEPKAGKSTLAWYVINAISRGESFLDATSRKANVLYVTEQNEVSFRQETLNVVGFSTNENTYVLLPEASPVSSWERRIEFWGDRLVATHSNVLVIDTFSSFASLPPNGENDSACIAERLMQLKQLYAKRPSLGIILIHHIRKPSIDPKYPPKAYADLRDARGSTAIVGGVDHCVMIAKSVEHPNVRHIHTEGRFEPENKFNIVLTDTGYKEFNSFRKGFREAHAEPKNTVL
jgi:archaellum biogenesis ATPase FlaH